MHEDWGEFLEYCLRMGFECYQSGLEAEVLYVFLSCKEILNQIYDKYGNLPYASPSLVISK